MISNIVIILFFLSLFLYPFFYVIIFIFIKQKTIKSNIRQFCGFAFDEKEKQEVSYLIEVYEAYIYIYIYIFFFLLNIIINDSLYCN